MNTTNIYQNDPKDHYSGSKWTSIFITFILCFDIISLGLNSFVNKYISYGTSLDSLLLYIIAAYIIVRALISSKMRMKTSSFLQLMILVVLLFGNFVFHPGNGQYIKTTDYIYIITSVVVLFVSSFYNSTSSIYLYMSKLYRVALIFGILHLLLGEKSGIYTTWMSDMTAGYSLLPAELFAIDYSFRFKRGYVWSALGAIAIFLFGSRGPILLVFVFFVLSLLRYTKSVKAKVLLIVGSAILIIFVYSKAYINVLLLLQQQFREYNLTIASIEKILYYEDISNGRNRIYNEIFSLINKKPFFGSGVFSDRSISAYSHNVFFEIIVDFGFVIGGPILCYMINRTFGVLTYAIKCKNEEQLSILLIVLLSSIGKLLFSGSYLTEPFFYLFLSIINQVNVKGSNQGVRQRGFLGRNVSERR